jgi:hypothetical protein
MRNFKMRERGAFQSSLRRTPSFTLQDTADRPFFRQAANPWHGARGTGHCRTIVPELPELHSQNNSPTDPVAVWRQNAAAPIEFLARFSYRTIRLVDFRPSW